MADEPLDELYPVGHQPEPLCSRCDDLDEARAMGVRICAIAIPIIPILLVFLDFLAAFNHIDWKMDEKLLTFSIGGVGLVLAFGFKKKGRG